MRVWVFTGTTESGDDVGPYLFKNKPTILELQTILKEDWPSEFEKNEEDWIDENFGYISSWNIDVAFIIEN